jgi:N-methylhydantoinase A
VGRYSIGVDIGGTFTDSVIREEDGPVVQEKAFTTPGAIGDGVAQCLKNAAARLGVHLSDLLEQTEVFKIGTTSAVNRLINQAGAKTALITTKGHEDAIIIGRVSQKTDGLSEAERADSSLWKKADLLVPRFLIRGINERVDCFGAVVCPLSDEEVEDMIEELLTSGIESFAVWFLWSFLNPAHELQAKRIIQRLAPASFVTLSSDIAPALGEYERMATTVINSYLGPGTGTDLASLEQRLRQEGLRQAVYLMQSTGGVVAAATGVQRPVYLLASGPVGGVIAAQTLKSEVVPANFITTDMGGTSFDVGVVVDGVPIERSVSLHHRYRVLVSSIEVKSVGAGGGSIAALDPVTSVLQVGPHSAGSVPGPVCYGFGGTAPTVTDANAVLGRLNPERFFAGRHRLDIARARQTLTDQIAVPLGISPEQAAEAIVKIVDSRMADLIRNLTIERGHDPRSFTLVAYGGGGPLHVGSYSREIGIETVIIPRAASTYSAWGIAGSPAIQHYVVSTPTILPVETSRLRERFQQLEERALSDLGVENPQMARTASLAVDMRYRYQNQELRVPLQRAELDGVSLSQNLMDRFETAYQKRFGRGSILRAAGIEISTFRLIVSEEFPRGKESSLVSRSRSEPVGRRDIWFDGAFLPVAIFNADLAGPGFRSAGPCVLEGDFLTIVVHPRQSIAVNTSGDFVLYVNE